MSCNKISVLCDKYAAGITWAEVTTKLPKRGRYVIFSGGFATEHKIFRTSKMRKFSLSSRDQMIKFRTRVS